MQDITEGLSRIAGPEHVRPADGGVAVAPANTDQIAAVLRFAQQNRLSVAPAGGGTKQGWGYPVQPAIVLEMDGMHVLREHTWQDMTCVVEAGCRWADLQAALAQHGQFVALDPLWPERATVGGIIATNDSGALRLRYGGLRDLVIGMTIVLADGTIAHTGGKVVKNVAGYDLHKLMIGAFGTLGVVASVNFRLHSIARSQKSFSVTSGSVEALGRLMLGLLHAQLSTVAIQLRGGAEGFALDLQIASLPEVLAAQRSAAEELARGEHLQWADAGEHVWGARQQVFGWELVCKGTMLPSEMARFASRVRALGGESVTQGTGIMVAGFPVTAAEGLAGLRREMEQGGGSLMVLKQPGEIGVDCWGTLPDSFPLMRAIKARFDPEGVVNPGRFLGRI